MDEQEAAMPEPMWTIEEVAARMAIKTRTVYEHMSGGLPSYKLKGARRFKPSEVEAYIAARRDG